MAYKFSVKDNKVLFSNNAVENLEIFELEFITDAPKLCRLLRREAAKIDDSQHLMDTNSEDMIKSRNMGLNEPATFILRFRNPYNIVNELTIHVTVREW